MSDDLCDVEIKDWWNRYFSKYKYLRDDLSDYFLFAINFDYYREKEKFEYRQLEKEK